MLGENRNYRSKGAIVQKPRDFRRTPRPLMPKVNHSGNGGLFTSVILHAEQLWGIAMKPFTVHVDIDLPRDEVITLFDNPDNLLKWQKGLQSLEHVSGEPGKPGAISKLVYLHNNKRVELTEKVTERNLPDEFKGEYSWDGGYNTLVNTFIPLSMNRTRWESTCEYYFHSFSMKLMGFFFAGMFRKETQLFLDNFKRFAEEGINSNT